MICIKKVDRVRKKEKEMILESIMRRPLLFLVSRRRESECLMHREEEYMLHHVLSFYSILKKIMLEISLSNKW